MYSTYNNALSLLPLELNIKMPSQINFKLQLATDYNLYGPTTRLIYQLEAKLGFEPGSVFESES